MKSLFILLVGFTSFTFAQTSSICGTAVTYDGDTYPMPKCWLKIGDSIVSRILGDFEGNFKFNNLKAGAYQVSLGGFMVDTTSVVEIELKEGENLDLGNIKLNESLVTGFRGCPGYYPAPIQINNDLKDAQKSMTITREDIKSMPNRTPRAIIDVVSDVIIADFEEPEIIRGSRAGDGIYFVDGVKSENMPALPLASFNKITIYSSGLPAKYGDTTSGAIVISTLGYFDLYYKNRW